MNLQPKQLRYLSYEFLATYYITFGCFCQIWLWTNVNNLLFNTYLLNNYHAIGACSARFKMEGLRLTSNFLAIFFFFFFFFFWGGGGGGGGGGGWIKPQIFMEVNFSRKLPKSGNFKCVLRNLSNMWWNFLRK